MADLRTETSPDSRPLLIVHSSGEVELLGTESENEIAIGKALAAMAYGLCRVTYPPKTP